jgi:SAM-dependent methyltransferase
VNAKDKVCLKTLTLALRHELEGSRDNGGNLQPGDLERRLDELGIRRDREHIPVDELTHLTEADQWARRVVDAFLESRRAAGVVRAEAVAEYVREAAYTWANRLLALRCMEARGLIDEVILQKEVYGGRSLQHHRLAQRFPERCAGEDDGLYEVLSEEFARQGGELAVLFDPGAPAGALRPSVAALKRCLAILSGTEILKGQQAPSDATFSAPDALGWTYQYWNTEEKDRVFETVRTKKGAKIEGADVIPATCIYTEPYMVKFLVQNSLGAVWMGMHPGSRLFESWEYYVRDAERVPVEMMPVREITFLDPACGSGHFLIEAFDLLFDMYREEGRLAKPEEICAAILEHNLYGVDIDERAVQIAALALAMKAKEKAPDLLPCRMNLVATNISLPLGTDHLEVFLQTYPEDLPLKPALETVLGSLQHAHELGSLLLIEEPIEEDLRKIRSRQIAEHELTTEDRQLLLFSIRATAQTSLPLGLESWDEWKRRTIERLRAHFAREAKASNLTAALFGQAAERGLSLVDVLSRRYDVVATNPPFLGTKYMGARYKDYLTKRFLLTKKDLFSAFLERSMQLCKGTGVAANVSMKSWLYQSAFKKYRASIFKDQSLMTFADLGSYAFDLDLGLHFGVSVILTCLGAWPPSEGHMISGVRCTTEEGSEAKGQAVADKLAGKVRGGRYRFPQAELKSVPDAPFCYWLPKKLLEALSSAPNLRGMVKQGLATTENNRFIRFDWEIPKVNHVLRWFPCAKGGTYQKWAGLDFVRVNWQEDGAAIKMVIPAKYPYLSGWQWVAKNSEYYFRPGLTYSYMCYGSLSARVLQNAIFEVASIGVFPPPDERYSVLGVLNCRTTSWILRALSQKHMFQAGMTERLPLPQLHSAKREYVDSLVLSCIRSKEKLLESDLKESAFLPGGLTGGAGLLEFGRLATSWRDSIAAILHTLEGTIERVVCTAYGLDEGNMTELTLELGTPAAWFPLISGYDSLPEPTEDASPLPLQLLDDLKGCTLLSPSLAQLAELKRRLRTLYEAGPGYLNDGEEPAADVSGEGEDDEEAEGGVGRQIPIPTETFLEGISVKLQIHPISVYWLLKEGREQEEWRCRHEERRFAEDNIAVMVLQLLGHRWPRQVAAGEPVPEWADRDGIIPLSPDTGEPTLLDRVRERIASRFGAHRVAAVEAGFQEIAGRSLAEWLASEFFKRHASQFKRRPIAWHLQSRPDPVTAGGRRGSLGRRAPAFASLVYYHALDRDLLPKIRALYVGPLRVRFETELRTLERLPVNKRSDDQEERKVTLGQRIEELKRFDTALATVIKDGFACPALDRIIATEAPDKWASLDGKAPPPASVEAFLAQERRYDPDLNDGVRINLAPLQKAGLLAINVLADKDVESAIGDRATWRADERQWCRGGKLSQPGWWVTTAKVSAGQEGFPLGCEAPTSLRSDP